MDSIINKVKRIIMNTDVTPPRPIAVKKLMENLVFLGLSRGKIPST